MQLVCKPAAIFGQLNIIKIKYKTIANDFKVIAIDIEMGEMFGG